MASPLTMNEEIFRQYAVIPALLRTGCSEIKCEKLRSSRRTDVLCLGPPPNNRPTVVEIKCPKRIDDMYRAVGQLMFYGVDYPGHLLILAIPAGILDDEFRTELEKIGHFKLMLVRYPDLSKITFTEQARPATLYK